MRRFPVIALCALLFLIAIPAPAHAWWDWLDDYSGPGTFRGPSLMWRLVCFNDPLVEQRAGATPLSFTDGSLQKLLQDLHVTTLGSNLTTGEISRNPTADGLNPNISLLQYRNLLATGIEGLSRERDAADKAMTTKTGREQIAAQSALTTIDASLMKAKRAFKEAELALQAEVDRVGALPNPGNSVLRSINSLKPVTGVKEGKQQYKQTKLSVAGQYSGTVGCLVQPSKNPVASLNIGQGWLWSKNNNLTYPPGTTNKPTVHLWQNELSFSAFVGENKAVELAIAVGLSHVWGEGFDSTTHFYFKPIELHITPVPLIRISSDGELKNKFWTDRLPRAFTLTGSITYMPKGFDAQDFGAVPGSFHSDKEILGSIGFFLDLSRF